MIKESAKGISDKVGMFSPVFDGLLELLNGNQQYNSQPLFNASAMKGMVSPYGFGGDVDDDTMEQLQTMADDNGISVEELIEMLQQQSSDTQEESVPLVNQNEDIEEEDIEEEEFAYGGKKMFAYGGKSVINVENKEVLQTPGGSLTKIKGPKHEQGGVNVAVPGGTKIYSDRLQIEGKTMQERKLKRERALKRLENLRAKDPTNQLLRNSLKRTVEVTQMEDAKDMALQKAMDSIFKGTAMAAFGGEVISTPSKQAVNKYALGGEEEEEYDPNDPFGIKKMLQRASGTLPDNTQSPYIGVQPAEKPSGRTPGTPTIVSAPKYDTPKSIKGDVDMDESTGAFNLGKNISVGDMIGLTGNALNAILPIINTRKNAAATKPNVNRYLGFGKDALDDNQKTQDILAKTRTKTDTDINTASNTSKLRNRNSARSVNTLRALDSVTEMNTTKARINADDNFARNMVGAVDKRAQIHNLKDRMEMSGETARDIEDKADTDNYYTNMAQNITNFGTNLQGIGRSFNRAKSNRIDANLIAQLSQYGLTFDENGKLITAKKNS